MNKCMSGYRQGDGERREWEILSQRGKDKQQRQTLRKRERGGKKQREKLQHSKWSESVMCEREGAAEINNRENACNLCNQASVT